MKSFFTYCACTHSDLWCVNPAQTENRVILTSCTTSHTLDYHVWVFDRKPFTSVRSCVTKFFKIVKQQRAVIQPKMIDAGLVYLHYIYLFQKFYVPAFPQYSMGTGLLQMKHLRIYLKRLRQLSATKDTFWTAMDRGNATIKVSGRLQIGRYSSHLHAYQKVMKRYL